MKVPAQSCSNRCQRPAGQHGAAMIEVLISMLIVAFGILGMFGMQTQATVSQLEAYQRAQALVLVKDMAQRMEANPLQIANYVTTVDIGTTAATDCTLETTTAARDKCEWGALLQGAAEKLGGSKVGAMIGARGCISRPDPVAAPNIYMVAVVWQGLRESGSPTVACGKDAYDSEATRRAVTVVLQLPVLS